ncbi:glutaredoxin family protein [Halorhabdus amylolytica]|uniref:glutaredoxin family protein n=1 Tax=Halorhabdus amylolytica TaxID=2559573 RepID=UPI0010AA3E6A|nr:glutaredoxin family protein [Halorhabdus amylolytica]
MSSDATSGSETVADRVDRVIADNEVVLFMKGTPQRPQCGFSQRAVGLIREHREDFTTVDVLESLPAYRDALEDHSGWETIPQTYIEGEFVGGSDILQEHEENGDLAEILPPENAGDGRPG